MSYGDETEGDGTAPALIDQDGDGWDDRWAAEFPTIDRGDPFADANGDGVPNFLEMAVNNDPFAPPPLNQLKPADPLREQRRQLDINERRARIRAVLAPYRNAGLRDADGRLITRRQRFALAEQRTRALAERLQREATERDQRVAAYLAGKGADLPDAMKASLVDLIDDHPRFVTGLSFDQANANDVIWVWPGSPVPRNLDGQDTAVAMWDLGGVDTGHEQFTPGSSTVVAPELPGFSSRIYNVQQATANEHATAVATIIAGAGDPAQTQPGDIFYTPATTRDEARGMAYHCGVRVYDVENDVGEMATLAADTLAGTQHVVFSNHAYGTACGWQLPYLAPPGTLWFWHGDPRLGESQPGAHDGPEDYQFGFYTPIVQSIDAMVHSAEIFLPVWAAGNEDDNITATEAPENQDSSPPSVFGQPHVVPMTGDVYDENHPNPPYRRGDGGTGALIPEACAKNVLTVTSWDSVGSDGPTDDWRMKPDIGAWGEAVFPQCALFNSSDDYRRFLGTSFSAASVTGSLALLRQRWQQFHGGTDHVLASTWKAIVLSGARNRAAIPAFNGDQVGYFGTLNLENAVELVEQDAEVTAYGIHSRVKEIVLANNSTGSFLIEHDPDAPPSGGGTGLFSVTICWTDPAGGPIPPEVDPDPANYRMLVNDIDLRITSESGITYFPRYVSDGFGRTEEGDNDRDNVEHISIPFGAPTDEVYTVSITHKDQLLGQLPQTVSVVVNGAFALAPKFRILDFSETGADLYSLTWASAVGGVYRIDRSTDLVSWSALPGEIIAMTEITAFDIDTSGFGPDHFFRVRQAF